MGMSTGSWAGEQQWHLSRQLRRDFSQSTLSDVSPLLQGLFGKKANSGKVEAPSRQVPEPHERGVRMDPLVMGIVPKGT
jgi:hypothetical protein